MPLSPVYCNQCAHPVENRFVDDRERPVCIKCGTVFYQNPLPVASAVVMNSKREVLMVKRKHNPRKGLWCLPIGFAEMGETIAQAALRELHEEAGIHGRVIRLLQARSLEVETYGELLIVTFEVGKTEGVERAGDDAEEIGYFNTNNLPPLAFEPNEYAIRYCIEAHKDEWEIQDSFYHMESDDHQKMLSDTLVEYLHDNAEKIALVWLNEVCKNPLTPSYAAEDPNILKDSVKSAIYHFTNWLSGIESYENVNGYFQLLGAERKNRGFSLHEVIFSHNLLRKFILNYVHEHGIWDRPIEAYRVLELDRRIMLFFDEIMYYSSRGYSGS